LINSNRNILIQNIVKIAKECSGGRNLNKVKRSLYKHIRIERSKNPANFSIDLSFATENKKKFKAREKPFKK